MIGLGFALLGLLFGVSAAAVHGGWIESLAAASAGFTGLATVFGYVAKTAAAPKSPV